MPARTAKPQSINHHNIVKLVPEMKARTVLIGSLSKSYCMAGWRAGFFAAPQPVVKAIANLQSHIASNPCNLVQYAALEAFAPENDAFVAGNLKQLTAQRATARQLLGQIPGLPCVAPDGAFYLFPDVSSVFGKSFKGRRVENVDCLAEMHLGQQARQLPRRDRLSPQQPSVGIRLLTTAGVEQFRSG